MAKQRPAAFAFILVTLLIDILGIGLVIPVLPKLVTQLAGGTPSTAASTYGFFVAVYAANQFLFAPILGALSDRFGRRPVLLISTLGTALDYCLMCYAPSLPLLFLGRVINGITAGNITTANAYVADVTAPEDRPKRFGMMGAVFGIGFIIGPVVGGLLGHYHLRWPFAFAAALAFLNFFYGLFVLPESHRPENRSAFRWAKANPFGAFFAVRQFQGVWPLAFVLLLLNFATFSLHSTWVLYTSYRYHWSELDVGLSLGFVGILAAVVQGGLTSRVVKRLGLHKTLHLGLACSAVAFLCYGLASRGWMVFPSMIIAAFGGLVGPAAQSLITRRVGPQNQGLAQGVLSSLSALAAIFAPITATTLFGLFSGPNAITELPGAPFFLGAACALCSAILATASLREPEPLPLPPAREPQSAAQ